MKEKYIELGYANGWGGKVPEIVKKCEERKHTLIVESSNRPYKCFDHTVTCKTCGYQYQYDSS